MNKKEFKELDSEQMIIEFNQLKENSISKDILRQKKKDLEHKLEVHEQGTWTLSENQKYELGAELSLINELLGEV